MAAPPPLPEPGSELTIPGFTLGHGSDLDGKTGVTVILCPEGAIAAADVRGSATGTRQFDALVNIHGLARQVHAVVLAGGSSYGLRCGDPVMEHLEARGFGFETGRRKVPLVPTAILFDLGFGDPEAVPGRERVEEALAAAAAGPVATGSVGAGTGATVGKAAGFERAMKGGFGFAALAVPGGPAVAAAAAVNAYGDVRHPDRGELVAGCRAAPDSAELLGAHRLLAAGIPEPHSWRGNTTLAVVMTDARLDRAAARKVCEMAFGAFYRIFSPALSIYDGDLIATLSLGAVEAHVHQVGVLAERALSHAILAAVRDADGFGVLPAVRDLGPAAHSTS